MFNRDTGKKRDEIEVPDWIYNLSINQWISELEMTDQEKKDNPKFFVAAGYLKTISYEEAWAKLWSEITGIRIGTDDTKKRELLPKADELIAKANELKAQAEKL